MINTKVCGAGAAMRKRPRGLEMQEFIGSTSNTSTTAVSTSASVGLQENRVVEEREPTDDIRRPRKRLRLDETDVHRMRKNISLLIRQKLRASAKLSASLCAQDDKVLRLAKRIENVLFRSARSIEDYADESTLDERFRALSLTMKKRATRNNKKEVTRVTGRESRKLELIRVLGMDKYREVMALRENVEKVGRKFFGASKQQENSIPKCVHALVRETSLINVLKRRPQEELQHLPWDEMILEGHQNMGVYLEWLAVSEVRE